MTSFTSASLLAVPLFVVVLGRLHHLHGRNLFVADFGDKGDDTIRFGDSATADVFSGALIQANAGNDSMTISGRLLTSTIRGGAGNDVLSLALGSTTGDNDIIDSYVYGDAGDDNISGSVVGGTIYGDNGSTGAGNDTFNFTALTSASVLGEGGNDSLIITGATSNSSLLGGDGLDTITVNGNFLAARAESASFFSFGANVSGSTISGEGNDTISFKGVSTGASIVGGSGDDSLVFTLATSGSITEGNINNTGSSVGASSTYYFGSGGGNDSINFSGLGATESGLVIAVSADFGSTGTLSSGVLTLGSGNTITFTGGASSAASATSANITYITVAQSTIDSLG